MDIKSIADTLVAHCRNHTEEQGLNELYADHAVSIEAFPNPESGTALTEGLEAIHGKHSWWNNNFEVHSSDLEGPFMHGEDRFAVIFSFDATHKPTNDRWNMKEVAIYTVANGKIVREEFYYSK